MLQVADVNRITGQIVHAALLVHLRLGPGLLESVYETILARDLTRKGLFVERQKSVSFDYEGLWFENAYRVDLLVERSIVVEVKSTIALSPAHHKQLLTYTRLLDCRVGLLLNFGAARMKDGIRRVAHRM